MIPAEHLPRAFMCARSISGHAARIRTLIRMQSTIGRLDTKALIHFTQEIHAAVVELLDLAQVKETERREAQENYLGGTEPR